MTTPGDRMTTQIYRVSVKIPPLWPEQTELWFHQLDDQFTISIIT